MRTMRHRAALIIAILVAGSASAQPLTPGDHTRSLVVGGLTRTYLVHVPPSYTGATAVPLVVDLHGWTATAEIQRSISGFLALSDARGFVVAWPQGVGNAWNGGVCCTSTPTDVEFIRSLVANLEIEANIDAARAGSRRFQWPSAPK